MPDDLFGHPTSARPQLQARIERLGRRVLPVLAQTMTYPVSEDHCFLRIAYDHAIQGAWPDVVDRPFYAHATNDQLQRALDALREMVEDVQAAHEMNRQSLRWRGKT